MMHKLLLSNVCVECGQVILFGMSLSFMLLNMLRFLDALKLSSSDFSKHSDLIGRLMVAKASGQRSGAIGESPIIVGCPSQPASSGVVGL